MRYSFPLQMMSTSHFLIPFISQFVVDGHCTSSQVLGAKFQTSTATTATGPLYVTVSHKQLQQSPYSICTVFIMGLVGRTGDETTFYFTCITSFFLPEPESIRPVSKCSADANIVLLKGECCTEILRWLVSTRTCSRKL